MRKLLSTLALAALMASMAISSAHAREGGYIRGDVGYSVDGEIDVEGEGTFDLDDDLMGDIGAGHNFGNGFRAEGELAYRNNGIDGVSFTDVETTSLMLNVFFDFNRDGGVQPYVGAGAGYANVEIEDQDDSNWAWQAMVGLGVPLDDNVTFDIAYRFFSVEDLDFSGTEIEYEHQAVTLGLRYQFGAPAATPVASTPPPPPPPPPQQTVCPTSEFTVYFEWDRSNLNAEAIETIDRAVERARQCNASAVTIVGHTDTSGSQEYNMGLSDRRAGVVRDALVARGMAAGMMTLQARGETDLARQTRDGVREPLNRRTAVTITFH